MTAQAARAADAPEGKKSSRAEFDWEDPFRLSDQLTDTELMVRESARSYCQSELMPRVRDAARYERFEHPRSQALLAIRLGRVAHGALVVGQLLVEQQGVGPVEGCFGGCHGVSGRNGERVATSLGLTANRGKRKI